MHQQKTCIKNNGYEQITISVNKKRYYLLIHRLVADAFIKNSNPLIYTQVNHLNGYKTDNHYWNLEWCTPEENIKHSYEMNLRHYKKGSEVPTSFHTELEVHEVCKLLEDNLSFKDIADITGFTKEMIRAIYNKRTWKHISKNYDFSNYNFGKNKSEELTKLENIKIACKMLESNKFTIKKISDITSLGYGILIKLKNGEIYKDISKNYNISNYTNKSKNKL